jgi:type I restriction enzyme S subunit
MSRSWAKVCLGEALRRSEETIKPYPDTEYREITVRLWGKGVVERGRILGASLNGRRFVAHAGQFIASKIDARNGAMGLIPESLEGALVTNDFPIFNLNKEKLEPRFLGWLCRTADFVELCLRASEGTTNRVRLKEERFLALEIPLPPLEEQQRVVARIEKMAAQIEEARALRKETADEVDALLRSVLDSDKNAQPVPLRELVKLRSPDVSVRVDENYQFAGVYCFGRGVFKGNLKSGLDFAYPRLTRLRAGEFVYPKLMAWEGAFGVVPKECDGCVVSTEFPVFEVNSDRVFPEVLDTYFCTPSVWPEVAGESTGTNVRRRRLNPQDFLNFKMPLPSRETQLMFMKIRAAMDELKPLQMETASTLDALMPALLDRAFKGEL